MKLFRCHSPGCSTDPAGRHIFDFQSEVPVCPKCGADRRKPEFRNIIVPLQVIHLHVKDAAGPDVGHGSRYRLACGGSAAGKRASGSQDAVNCGKCKESPEYKAWIEENDEFGVQAELDVALNVDHKAAQYTVAK